MGKITRALQKASQENTRPLEMPGSIDVCDGMAAPKLKYLQLDGRLIAYFRPKAEISGQYKSLASNIFSLNNGKPPKTIAITSAIPAEGKTVSSLNLAFTLSHADHKPRVIVIDADMRKGQLLEFLGTSNRKGLSEYLQGEAGLDEIIFGLEDSGHLDFIAAGAVTPNPEALLGGPRMKELIQALQDKYNFVLFDTPAVIPVTDAAIIGSMVEGVILIIKAGHTQRGTVSRAMEQLVHAHSNIIGHVLTGVENFIPANIYRYLEGIKT